MRRRTARAVSRVFLAMATTLRRHWPEYLCEGIGLGLFMLSATTFAVLLFHPASVLGPGQPLVRRALMGLAMGATAVAIIYSPAGRRSGAHLNPAVTLTFLRLGKVEWTDAVFYVLAQVGGGLLGMLVAASVFRPLVAHPSVDYVVTVPGPLGLFAAFTAEVAMTAVLMTVVLRTSSAARLAPFTGVFAGTLVATYITLEAPISGMSLNPARTLASAVPAGVWTGWWIYFTAPLVGMLTAAELHRGLGRPVLCAKLHHVRTVRCIFRCGYASQEGGMGDSSVPAAPHSKEVQVMSRRRAPVIVTLAVVLVGVWLAVAYTAAAPETPPLVSTVDAIGITVANMDRSVAFYRDLFGFEPVGEREVGEPGARARVVRLRLGSEAIELVQWLQSPGREVPGDSRSNDRWFQHIAIIVNDMDQAYLWLTRHHVQGISPSPQRLPDWNPAAGGIRAYYFKDPDGHALEILEFPPDKGDVRWRRPSDRVFLGIDHTAIVVGDTDAALRFYRDTLGLRVVGTSENRGPEQEQLNAVPGARLRVTTLRSLSGPGVELLEYLSPRDGRPARPDAQATDLTHWRRILTADLARASKALDRAVPKPNDALVVRDPDGHAVELHAR